MAKTALSVGINSTAGGKTLYDATASLSGVPCFNQAGLFDAGKVETRRQPSRLVEAPLLSLKSR